MRNIEALDLPAEILMHFRRHAFRIQSQAWSRYGAAFYCIVAGKMSGRV